MCLVFKSIKTAEEDLTFYKAVYIKGGKFITPYLDFSIEIGKEYTLDTNLVELLKYSNGEIGNGVFHLCVEKPEGGIYFVLKTIVKKGESYLKGNNGDAGVTRVCYEYLNDEDKKAYESLLKISKNYDVMYYHTSGLYKVLKDFKCNLINAEGKFLSEQWFDGVWGFSEGFARVGKNYKYNFINIEGKLLSEQWFDFAFDFREGFAKVELSDKFQSKWNYIDAEGKLLSEIWFDWVMNFHAGLAEVNLNNKWYKIDTNGNIC